MQFIMQVGGWTEVYDGLTFATVRGAGHEVPLFQPRRAFELFQSFLSGKNLPKSWSACVTETETAAKCSFEKLNVTANQ